MNIPIDSKLLNKYNNVSELISDNLIYKKTNINISSELLDLNCLKIENMNATHIYHLAVKIFQQHNFKNSFLNCGNTILISNSDIKESINKIYYNKNQKKYLKEHLLIYAYLGKIIETAILISQNYELKQRNKYLSWNYYVKNIKINEKDYLFEFHVLSKLNG